MYMFFWFFKQLYYCLRRIFKSGILLLIIFFIAFLFIFIKPSFAFSTGDETPGAYGYYNGFSSSQIETINGFIESNQGNYDSFFVRAYKTSSTQFITMFFYNFSDIGRLYKIDINNANQPYFVFEAHNLTDVSNSVYYRTYLLPDLTYYDDGYFNNLSASTCSLDGNRDHFCLYTNRDIYTNTQFNNTFFYGGNIALNNPYITTPTNDIVNFSFSTLTINARFFTL